MISRVCGVVALLLLTGVSHASSKSLTLDQFINVVLANNPGVQKILAQPAIAQGELVSSFGIKDPVLGFGGRAARVEPNRILGSEPDSTDSIGFDATINKTLIDSGTRFSAGVSNNYYNPSPSSSPLGNSYYQPSLTLQITQPLLKNAQGTQDRLNIRLNTLNVELATLQAQESLESYISQLAALYLNWHNAWQEQSIVHEEYKNVIQQEKLVRLKVKRQLSESYELLRIQEVREDYFARWQQSIGTYQGLTAKVLRQMNRVTEKAGSTHQPTLPNGNPLFLFDEGKLDTQLSSTRLMSILENLKAQQLELLTARDDARQPDLDLTLGYTRHGADSGAFDSVTSELDKNDYSVNLQYRYPLGNRAAQGRYQSQAASKKQVYADTAQQLINAQASLADLLAREKQLAIALAANDRKIKLATRKLREEKKLYIIGEFELFELQQDETAQLESRLNRVRLYTQLQQIRLQIGELLDRNLAHYLTDSKLPLRN
jgi:outer membrane protein